MSRSQTSPRPLLAGVEAGGTKFVCAVGTGPDDLRETTRFPAAAPAETLRTVVEFFQQARKRHGPVAAVGIGSFGPLDPDPRSPSFGYITTTPKPHWAQTDLVGPLREALGVPVGFDTDVNAAALGEWRWGAGQGADPLVYLTIGTGIGGGGVVRGQLMHGLVHPEMGHIRLPRDPARDPFRGCCPFHGDCLEGLASGPAIEARWGVRAETLAADHVGWEIEAEYLALAAVNIICVLSPRRIVMGGGVMEQTHLFPRIRRRVQALLNGYVASAAILDRIDDYIVPPALGNLAGVAGAIALAERALEG